MAHLIFPVVAHKDELRGGLEIPAHWVGFIFLFYESCWKFGNVKVYGQEMWLFERLEISRHPFMFIKAVLHILDWAVFSSLLKVEFLS